jgi:2-phosphosulfolactate phosphatase
LALEDTLFAGSLLYHLFNEQLSIKVKDGAKIAFGLYEKYKDTIEETISGSDHAHCLSKLVPKNDITFCCQLNEFDVLPSMRDGLITNLND